MAAVDDAEERAVEAADGALRSRETTLSDDHERAVDKLSREQATALADLTRRLEGLPILGGAITQLQEDFDAKRTALDDALASALGDARSRHDKDIDRVHEKAETDREAVNKRYPNG